MINLICLTNKCKKYIICNNWVCFFDKLTISLFHPAKFPSKPEEIAPLFPVRWLMISSGWQSRLPYWDRLFRSDRSG